MEEKMRVGFEAALDEGFPGWREWPEGTVEVAKYFYNRAIRDTSVFVNSSIAGIHEGYVWLQNSTELKQEDADKEG